jgi:GNAT superfamily N-acetyltransferase
LPLAAGRWPLAAGRWPSPEHSLQAPKELPAVTATWQIRPAVPGDAERILTVSDEATMWLVEHGMSGQWGAQPPSSEPVFVSRVSSWISDGEAVVAIDSNGDVQGYAVTGSSPPPYMDPIVAKRAVEDAYYVYTVASRMHPESRGAGRSLIMWAAEQARALGVTYLRLDCWADNALLRAYYGNLGFEECDTYVDDGWRGAVMQRRA